MSLLNRLLNKCKTKEENESNDMSKKIDYKNSKGLSASSVDFNKVAPRGPVKKGFSSGYTLAEKEAIIAYFLNNKITSNELGNLYNVSGTTILNWLRHYRIKYGLNHAAKKENKYSKVDMGNESKKVSIPSLDDTRFNIEEELRQVIASLNEDIESLKLENVRLKELYLGAILRKE